MLWIKWPLYVNTRTTHIIYSKRNFKNGDDVLHCNCIQNATVLFSINAIRLLHFECQTTLTQILDLKFKQQNMDKTAFNLATILFIQIDK